MNIFYLDPDPALAAQYHCDKHVVKMTLETAQILATAKRYLLRRIKDDIPQALYRSTHSNHPCVVWTQTSLQNYQWTLNLFQALLVEYHHRYGRDHKSTEQLPWLSPPSPGRFPCNRPTAPAQAMPEEYRHADPVTAYRAYYLGEKSKFAVWTRRKMPEWYKKGFTALETSGIKNVSVGERPRPPTGKRFKMFNFGEVKTADLVAAHNAVAATPVKKFADRKTAESRTGAYRAQVTDKELLVLRAAVNSDHFRDTWVPGKGLGDFLGSTGWTDCIESGLVPQGQNAIIGSLTEKGLMNSNGESFTLTALAWITLWETEQYMIEPESPAKEKKETRRVSNPSYKLVDADKAAKGIMREISQAFGEGRSLDDVVAELTKEFEQPRGVAFGKDPRGFVRGYAREAAKRGALTEI